MIGWSIVEPQLIFRTCISHNYDVVSLDYDVVSLDYDVMILLSVRRVSQ